MKASHQEAWITPELVKSFDPCWSDGGIDLTFGDLDAVTVQDILDADDKVVDADDRRWLLLRLLRHVGGSRALRRLACIVARRALIKCGHSDPRSTNAVRAVWKGASATEEAEDALAELSSSSPRAVVIAATAAVTVTEDHSYAPHHVISMCCHDAGDDFWDAVDRQIARHIRRYRAKQSDCASGRQSRATAYVFGR